MTHSTIRLNKYFLPILLFSILFATSIYLFPRMPRFSARPLNTRRPPHFNIHDDSLLVRGVYWELPLAGVHTLVLDCNKLEVTGDSISYSGAVCLSKITEIIPPELTATKLEMDTSGTWFESDVILCLGNDSHCYRTYDRFTTRESFCYEEPFRSLYQIEHTYRGQGDTTVIVFAFGKMNQDIAKWMGYLLITKRHPA
jgi:hypothetical protein